MQITALIAQKNNPNRVNVIVDGKFKAGITLDTAVKNHLKVGNVLDDNQISLLESASYCETLLAKALNFISIRPRSEKEVKDYLLRKAKTAKKILPSEKIEEIIKRLKELDYLNDSKFASWWIQNRQNFRPKGKMALKIELTKKGVSREAVEEALNSQQELISEDKNALIIAQKRLSRLRNLPQEKQKEKLLRYIMSRGFSFDTAKSVIDDLLSKE